MTARLLPPRVPLTDPRTGTIAREWYLYFLALNRDVNDIDGNALGFAPVAAPIDFAIEAQNALGLQPGAVPIDLTALSQDALGLAPGADVGGIAAAIGDMQQYGIDPIVGALAARVAALESIVNDLRLGAPVL